MTTTHTKRNATTKTHSNPEVTMKTKPKTTHVTATSTPASPVRAAPEVAASTTPASSPITAQIQAIEESCGYPPTLADEDRKASNALVRRVPASILERVITLASRGGGSVAGIKFDPAEAKAALAEADDAEAVATAAQILARRAQDHAVTLRAGVAGGASTIRTTLRGYVKSPEGASLAAESEELTALAKQHLAARKARKTRAENTVKAGSPTAPPPTETPAPATPTPAPAAQAATKGS